MHPSSQHGAVLLGHSDGGYEKHAGYVLPLWNSGWDEV